MDVGCLFGWFFWGVVFLGFFFKDLMKWEHWLNIEIWVENWKYMFNAFTVLHVAAKILYFFFLIHAFGSKRKMP